MKDTHFILLLCGDLAFPGFGATEEERWMNLMLQPEICRKIAELQGKRLLREVPLYAQLGVDGIMPCGDLGSSTGLLASPRIYREMVYPWHKAQVDEAHRYGLKVLKHCCGHVWPVIDDLAERLRRLRGHPGLGGHGHQRAEGARRRPAVPVGRHLARAHHPGHAEDIRNDARYAFTHAAPGGGYIMGSTHSLAVDAKRENILEMKRCRDEWGVYPIDPRRFS